MEEEKNVILSAKDVEVKFRVRDKYLTAIRGVSLDLYDGETFAIVGESGSGKSVFTKTFTGMLETNGMVTNGSMMFHGQDLTKLKTDKDWEGIRGAKISTIFQDPMTSLNPIRTIGSQITEVIEKHQGASKSEAKAQAIHMMERVGIPNAANRFDEYPFQYSGGMRQRIVIAIALACHPEILICDEPTTALDVTIQAQIIALIRDLQKELQFTTLYITHDLGVVANVANRVGVMYGGQIVEYGTVEEIFFDPRHPYTWALLSSLPQLGVKGQDLYYIAGTPPSLYNEIKGDAFAPRNEHALKIDFEQEPPFFQVSDTHFAKTWLLDPRAPKLEKPEIIRDLHAKIKMLTDEGGAFHVG
ncbi:MAG: ABC transporter ATP-binding protein [Clostridia bacterium]|nr:ABC transporter ATP-binding protein [Clostridia bacterium]